MQDKGEFRAIHPPPAYTTQAEIDTALERGAEAREEMQRQYQLKKFNDKLFKAAEEVGRMLYGEEK